MTRRRDARVASDDPALRVLADSFVPVCTLVGKTWGLHLEKVVKVDRDENLRMISDSIAFLVAAGKRVVYDAEHFFDGFGDDPAYALACLRAAIEAAPRPWSAVTPTAARCPTRWPRRWRRWCRRCRDRRPDRDPLPR